MRISTRGRYGVRALLNMALFYPQGPVNLKELSKRQDLSLKYLEQLIIPLKAAGLVKGVRGPFGGYQLARPPDKVTLGDILRVLEGSLAPVDCVDNPEDCPRWKGCVTFDVWKEIDQAVRNVVDSITLADLIQRQKKKNRQIPMGRK